MLSLDVADGCISSSALVPWSCLRRRVSTLVTNLLMGTGELPSFSTVSFVVCCRRTATRRGSSGSSLLTGSGERPSSPAVSSLLPCSSFSSRIRCRRAANRSCSFRRLSGPLVVFLIKPGLSSCTPPPGVFCFSSTAPDVDVVGVSACALDAVGAVLRTSDAALLIAALHQLEVPAAVAVVRSDASRDLLLPPSSALAFRLCGNSSPAVENLTRAVLWAQRTWFAVPGG